MVETVDRNVSIQILRPKTKNLLSSLLNSDKIIPTDSGLQRDWRGLAGLCNINGQYGPSIQKNSDPTNMVLSMWLENDAKNCTINKLLSYLEELDRFDVVDDITELIEEDIRVYNTKPYYLATETPNLDMDKYILTGDDLKRINEGLPLETYDAFVLFSDDDIGFATEVIDTMEKQYEMKFFVIERDLVPGGLKYDVMVRAITERCNRLIVILSDAFFESDSNTFYLRLAQSFGAESQRKVIPCIYKPCNLPADMKCYFTMDYRRATSLWNFWDKLRDTIRVPNKAASESLLLTRSKSDNHNVLRSALHHETNSNTLKPMHQVKFNSMVNLNNYDSDKILPDHSLSAESIANDKVDNTTKKKSKKPNWLKKMLRKHIKSKTAEIAS